MNDAYAQIQAENEELRAAYETEVEALIAQAEADPAAYRKRIVRWIAIGYGFLFLVLGLALAAVVVGGAVALAGIYFGKAGVGVIKLGIYVGIPLFLLLGALFRALFARVPRPEGRALTSAEAPGLFAALEKMRLQVGVGPIQAVFLDPDLNAAVIEHPKLGLFPWFERYVRVGFPLLQAMSPDEVKAVLAHELGHLSKAHGSLGSFVYRARRVWVSVYERLLTEGLAGGKTLAKFITWYVPKFDKISFAIARQNEYEADAISAELTSEEAAASALCRVNLLEDRLERFEASVWTRCRAGEDLPEQLFTERGRWLREEEPSEELERRLAGVMARVTDTSDTHPALVDRLAGMKVEAAVPAPVGSSAAEVFLGAALPRLEGEFNELARQNLEATWAEMSARAEQLREQRQELEAKDGRTSAEQYELARVYWFFDLHDQAGAILRTLDDDDEVGTDAQVLLGHVLLEAGGALEEEGAQLLERVIGHHPTKVGEAGQALHAYYLRRARWEDAKALLTGAADSAELAERLAVEREGFDHQTDDVLPADHPDLEGRLRAEIERHKRVNRVYFFQKKLSVTADQGPLYVVMVSFKDKMMTATPGHDFYDLLTELAEAVPHEEEVLWLLYDLSWPETKLKEIAKMPGGRLK